MTQINTKNALDKCLAPIEEKEDELIVDLGHQGFEEEFLGDEELAMKPKYEGDKDWQVKPEELPLIKKLIDEFPELDYEMASCAFKWCELYPEQVEAYKEGTLDLGPQVERPKPDILKGDEYVYVEPELKTLKEE